MGFLPVLIATNVLRSQGLLPNGRTAPAKGGSATNATAIILSIVTWILGVAAIVAGICSRNWTMCAIIGALLAVQGALLYWGFKK